MSGANISTPWDMLLRTIRSSCCRPFAIDGSLRDRRLARTTEIGAAVSARQLVLTNLPSIAACHAQDGKVRRLGLDFSHLLNRLPGVLFKSAVTRSPKPHCGGGAEQIDAGLTDDAQNRLRVAPILAIAFRCDRRRCKWACFNHAIRFASCAKVRAIEIHYLAHIDVEGRPSPLSCIIWDISGNGAKLTVADEQNVPDEFTLIFRRHCRVVRRYDGQIGVLFVSA